MLPAVRWTAVVPLKDPAQAKQRLTGLAAARPALAVAFAADVLTALLGSRRIGEVVVVGGAGLPDQVEGDPRVHRAADVRGLDAAIAAGISVARRSSDTGVLVLPGDLPCLRSADVDLLLDAAQPDAVRVLPDAEGDGTTAVVAAPGAGFTPSFGPGSYRRHLADGAGPVADAQAVRLATARRDVDTIEHLREASRIGVGAHTARILADLDATTLCPAGPAAR